MGVLGPTITSGLQLRDWFANRDRNVTCFVPIPPTGDGSTGSSNMMPYVWTRPATASLIQIFIQGSGGGGGAGQSGAAGTARTGGSGGNSGRCQVWFGPAFICPPVLYLSPGRGGRGGVPGLDAYGTGAVGDGENGKPTYIWPGNPWIDTTLLTTNFMQVPGGTRGRIGTAFIADSFNSGTEQNAAHGFGGLFHTQGQQGTSGSTGSGNASSVTAWVAGTARCGGGGGGGITTTTVRNGGGITTPAPTLVPSIAGGVGGNPATSGGNGVMYTPGSAVPSLASLGGGGGGSSNTGAGGNGGDAAPGSGGGGGGAGTTGGAGGRGGDGYIVITWV